jgi:glycosyltransferase involved in cell wall biosynthesis
LSPKNLRQRLSHALALVVPSLVEGFCLPALEAQSCGTPVICRPVPALRELVTEHDTVASDFSVESLAKAISQGISRGVSGRRQVVQAHIDRFSCAVVGAQVKSEYQKVLANGRAR